MQVTLCEQLTSYLTKFKPATRNSTASTSAAAVDIPGMQVFKKKGMQVALDTVDWLTAWLSSAELCNSCTSCAWDRHMLGTCIWVMWSVFEKMQNLRPSEMSSACIQFLCKELQERILVETA